MTVNFPRREKHNDVPPLEPCENSSHRGHSQSRLPRNENDVTVELRQAGEKSPLDSDYGDIVPVEGGQKRESVHNTWVINNDEGSFADVRLFAGLRTVTGDLRLA